VPEPPEEDFGAPAELGAGGGAAVAVVDGGDGRIGALLIDALRRQLPQVNLWPVGLNDAAQEAMDGALGLPVLPDVPLDALEQAMAILGPNDIVIPGGLSGEVPPELAAAVVESPARKILLPSEDPRLRWVAAPAWSAERWVQKAVAEVAGLLNGQ
jgi:hypothetical protein